MEGQGQGGVFLRGLGLSTIAFDSGSQSITEVVKVHVIFFVDG